MHKLMKLYISSTGIKRVLVSNSPTGKAVAGGGGGRSSRRITSRTVAFGIILLVLFLRIAILLLQSSTLDCLGRRFLGGGDSSLRLKDELTRALLEAKEGGFNEVPIESFNQLVKETTSKRQDQDLKAFAFGVKAMLSRMEHEVQSARQRESVYWHLASHSVPKTLHCLCLKLAEEYAVNALARCHLPSPEYVSRLSNPSFHHVVLLTDNVLAASVVISSTVQNVENPEKFVFHIVTDKKTYSAMHAWFAIHPIKSAVVEVKGLHQYDWSEEINDGVQDMVTIHRLIWNHHCDNLKQDDFQERRRLRRCLEVLNPNNLSLLNQLRMYLPELFPDLNKIVLLDDDVVVQHDLSSLWELDLNEKVVGAVFDSWCEENCCLGTRYKDYLNFSHPIISSACNESDFAWIYGMNVFDLEAWRRVNITRNYHKWLTLNLNSGLELWQPGVFPPALLTFKGYVHPMDPSWHAAGLGHRHREYRREILTAAVLHFSGPAKPWLDIASREVRSLWNRNLNISNKFIRKCGYVG
ncbi:hypothetical protein K2173_023237 [Erythroxylum novogranatense]|uniref:Hexosyltransferase n=1 Tax=Erythroxylum novogranatense TaxID=1862640 RepID=A0AAV8T8B0_9ROSI|nr:hypothetical protein K2173_023237 [Erythroxylum novogranatense]